MLGRNGTENFVALSDHWHACRGLVYRREVISRADYVVQFAPKSPREHFFMLVVLIFVVLSPHDWVGTKMENPL